MSRSLTGHRTGNAGSIKEKVMRSKMKAVFKMK